MNAKTSVVEDGVGMDFINMDAINDAIAMAMGSIPDMASAVEAMVAAIEAPVAVTPHPDDALIAEMIAAEMMAEFAPVSAPVSAVLSDDAGAVKAAEKTSRKAAAEGFTIEGMVTAKAEKVKTPKAPKAPGEKSERAPRGPKHPGLSPTFGTPILGIAADKCSVCATIVKWYKTTNTAGENVWECPECSRIAPRGVRAKA